VTTSTPTGAEEADMDEILECLDNHDDSCDGVIGWRYPLSGTGRSFPRCDRHWDMRLQAEHDIHMRYPNQQPADFDPMYAGERWDEDY
jgi:hypothetical protein